MSQHITKGARLSVSLEHAILGFLSEHPRSGYDLKVRCFDESARPFWTADQAQIYRTLERLQTSKLVGRTRRRSAGRPDRLVYEITAAGDEALAEWLSSAAPLPPSRDAFALQLHFSAGLDDDTLAAVLAQRRALHQDRLDYLRRQSEDLATSGSGSQRAMVLRQTALDGAIARERVAVDWLDQCIEAIERGALPPSADGVIGEKHLSGA